MTQSIVIAYHSGYGHTKKVAEAIAKGARADNTFVSLVPVDGITDAQWDEMDKATAIIFGSPTYMGSASAAFKTFMEVTSKRWYERKWKDKIAAGFTNSGSLSGDKQVTLQQLVTFAMQHGMIWVGQAELAPTMGGTDVAPADAVNRIGSYSGLMTQSNNESPDIAPTTGDLETAELFGKRVAEITARLK